MPPKISLIAAVDQNGGLGKNNQLLCHLPADLKHFKALTINKTILMGYNTFKSIGKPLANRKNIVLSKKNIKMEGVTLVSSITEAMALISDQEELMVIGGANVYRQFMDKADQIYLTEIQYKFSADVFFPEIDSACWSITAQEKRIKDEKNAYDVIFYTYNRVF